MNRPQTSPAIDIARARADTPGCAGVVHFNNAGAGLMPQPVIDAVKEHIDLEARIGGYEAEDLARDRLDEIYRSIAWMLNCKTEEIALVENATVAWNTAFYSLPLRPGDRVLTAMAEYASNFLNYLHAAKRLGVVVEPVPNDETGQLDTDALERMIDGRVKLIAITHVPTNSGLVNPAAEIGRIARKNNIPYLLDACQSVGQMKIDVEEIGCDLLSATGRKYLRGPRGTGFLYVRDSILEKLDPPWLDLRSARWVDPDRYELAPGARRFENWEFNFAALLGLGAAVEYALDWGLDAIEDYVTAYAAHLREELHAIPGVSVRDIGARQCGIVTFRVRGKAEEIAAALTTEGINVSVSVASSTLLDMRARGLDNVVRAGVHYYNDEAEAERFLTAIRRLAAEI
ncbi:MAG: aminotransferase class V-fold PLP-dependent enzyme [Rhodospirillaceae bacterium]|jgi:cysteine desulfurase / selenocysteine lyase|nr:aminotransferase class V-fold PLP-dependent enzyme [Rhodospirillaceae bacterium]